jgi:hypothetical protein
MDSRSAGVAAAEIVLYVAVTLAATLALERSLLREVRAYLAGRRPAGTGAAATPA